MAFGHRKLIIDAINETITEEICPSFCEESDDNSGFCPERCLSFCSNICLYPVESLINPPSPQISETQKPHKISLFLIIPLAAVVATFLVICCYVLYLKYHSRNQNQRSRRRLEQQLDQTRDFLDEDRGPVVDHHVWYIKTVGLQPSIINSIAVCKYKRDDGLVEGTDCSVCLNEFQEDETLRLLPKCNHAFHIPCIDTWLLSHTNCPMCRAPIVKNTPRALTVDRTVESSIQPEEVLGTGNSDREMEDEGRELGIMIEENGLEIQPMRRSISLDSLSALKISLTLKEEESNGTVISNSSSSTNAKRLDRNQNLQRSMASSSMKRSSSCSG